MSKATWTAARLLVYSGIAALCQRSRQKSRTPRMTILTYHRIGEAEEAGEFTDPQMISASPTGFDWQMAYISRHFTALPLEEVIDRRRSGQPLPPDIAVITFDDGYQDNYSLAYPVLRRYELPATIFLTTGFVGQASTGNGPPNNMWWDELVYLIGATRSKAVSVPGLGDLGLESKSDRGRAREKLRHHLKSLNDGERGKQVSALKHALDPDHKIRPRTPAPLSWEEVCEMSRNGVSFGAHTHSHPILTRVSAEEAEREIALSKKLVEGELGKPVRLFAYPNGKAGDFDARIRRLVIQSGFDAAVTLLHGSNRLASQELDWYMLRRIYVGSDDRTTFVAKVSGAFEMFASRLPVMQPRGY